MVFLPPTSDFPPDPEPLSREDLNSTYLELRNCYKSSIAGDLEDAGDDLVNEFGRYKLGRKTYQGGSFLGGLVQAVIRFINRWTHTKERVVQLDQKRQEFIEKTKDLPPLTVGGNGHGGPVNQPEPTPAAKVEIVDSAAAQPAEEARVDGPTH